ncbi:MAG: DUF4388 domain-containing protein [Nitrospiraceae bacterium]|nr:MAG: DUF4388 domain-containing protein [Nitrospiraceae bacterium]
MLEEDKRQFARYRKQSLCDVRIGSELHKGKVVDYSNGVGILIKKVPELVKGAIAEIEILDYEIKFSGEVVWTEDFGYQLRVGFRRLNNLRGNLKHYRLIDILLGLSKSRKTGILEIIVGSTVKKIYIDNGLKIFAVSTNTNDRLGEYLLTQGKITLEEYNQASYLVEKKGQRLGQVLIDLGYLKPSDLAPSVQHQVEEIIMGLFNIDEGIFEFKEVPLPTDEPIKLQVSTPNLIYKGIKRINSFPMIDKMCPPLDTVFNLAKDPLPLFQSLDILDADKKVLSYVNGIHPLKGILTLSHTSNFETLKSVIALMTIGLITIKGENDTPVKLPLEVIFGEPDKTQPVEPDEETQEEVTTDIGAGAAEMTDTQTNIVEKQENVKEPTKEEESAVPALPEAPASEITDEDSHDDESADVNAEATEWAVEYTNMVENQENMKASDEEELAISTPPEVPVSEINEDTHSEEMASLRAESAEETIEHVKTSESISKMNVISESHLSFIDEHDEIQAENITEQTDEKQSITYTAGYVNETSGVPEPAAMESEMAAAAGEEAYVQMNDMTSENTSTDVLPNTVLQNDESADTAAKPKSRKILIISIVMIIILVGAIVPIIYEYITMPLSPPAVTTIKKSESLSPVNNEASEKVNAGMPQDKSSFPVFREDAIKKFLNE